MTLRTGEDTVSRRRKLEIALCGGIVLEEALDLSFDRLLMMMMMMRHNLELYIIIDSNMCIFTI